MMKKLLVFALSLSLISLSGCAMPSNLDEAKQAVSDVKDKAENAKNTVSNVKTIAENMKGVVDENGNIDSDKAVEVIVGCYNLYAGTNFTREELETKIVNGESEELINKISNIDNAQAQKAAELVQQVVNEYNETGDLNQAITDVASSQDINEIMNELANAQPFDATMDALQSGQLQDVVNNVISTEPVEEAPKSGIINPDSILNK